jgi:hypothetical protein
MSGLADTANKTSDYGLRTLTGTPGPAPKAGCWGCSSSRSRLNVWLQSRSLPARGRVGLEVRRCLCLIDAGYVFISTVMGPEPYK